MKDTNNNTIIEIVINNKRAFMLIENTKPIKFYSNASFSKKRYCR